MADKILAGATQAVAVTALKAQQARMRLIAENMANANSTSGPGQEPYRRQAPVFEVQRMANGAQGVKLSRIEEDKEPFKTEYDPGNPSADNMGYVKMPNVDPLIEAMDMRDAQRAYEANLNVIETARAMDSRILDILKK
jgi:flagellar basal-body rod protein FlgC